MQAVLPLLLLGCWGGCWCCRLSTQPAGVCACAAPSSAFQTTPHRYIRDDQRRAIAAGEIEDSDGSEEGNSPQTKLEQVVVSQDVAK